MKDQRYKGKEEDQQKKSFLRKTVEATAIVGTGAAIYANRDAIRRAAYVLGGEGITRVSRAFSNNSDIARLMSNTHIVGKGLSDALGDNPSITRLLRALTNEDIQRQYKHRYERSVISNLKEQYAHGIENRKKTDFVDKFIKTFRPDQKQKDGHDHFVYEALKAEQRQRILNELKKNKMIIL